MCLKINLILLILLNILSLTVSLLYHYNLININYCSYDGTYILIKCITLNYEPKHLNNKNKKHINVKDILYQKQK